MNLPKLPTDFPASIELPKGGLNRKSWKLTEEQKIFLCRLIGYHYTSREVVEEIEKEFGIKLSLAMVELRYRASVKWRPVIEKFRQEYLSRYDDVPGFHKKVRLDRMERAYQMAKSQQDVKAIISVTEHQRKEVEGAGDTSLTLISNRYYNMTDAELDKRQKEVVEQLKKEGMFDDIRRIEVKTGESGKDNGAKDV